MIPKRAIERVIQRGWRPEYLDRTAILADPRRAAELLAQDERTSCRIALDPTFWQALGKALNWPSDDPSDPVPPGMRWGEWKRARPWGRAMRFFDLVMTGENLTAYWNDILP